MARSLAYDVLTRVDEHGAFSNRALDAELAPREIDERDRRLATEIAYGVLTWRRALDTVLDEIVHGGVASLDVEVLRTLRIGAYQLLFLDRVPAHAAVDEAVEMTKERANRGATSLVNAVLREIDRQGEIRWWSEADRDEKPVRYLGERYSLPNWLSNRMIQLFGLDRAEALAEAFNDRPPIYLRQIGEARPEDLDAMEGELEPVDGVPRAIRADRMNETIEAELAGRRWIIQDLGSQLVGEFVGSRPGDRVLDGCAGLGGKTMTMADRVGPEGRVLAVDHIKWKVDKLMRLARDSELAGRIGVKAADLKALSPESVGEFGRVLVDAPCSALGVIRRHPEIKWHRDESDLPALVAIQEELLEAAARFVEPGGVLVYSVCTFTTEESVKQIEAFLERHEEFERADIPEATEIDWDPYVDDDGALTLNPVDHGSDAFFAARLRRSAD